MMHDLIQFDRRPGAITFVRSEADFANYRHDEPTEDPALVVGDYFLKKYREQAQRSGVQAAARNLKKQGVPVEIATLILAVRS